MPSRTPGNASGQPRRSKSFSSTGPEEVKHAKSFITSEPVHPEALTAAELAFERARERHAAENGYEYSSASNARHTALRPDGRRLGRRQSVRFTGSSAVQTRELPNTRREVFDHQDGPDAKNKASPREYVETIVASEPSSYRKLRKAKSMFAPGRPPSVISTDGTNTSRGHFKRGSMRSSESHNGPPRLPDHRLRRSFSFLRGVTDRLSTGNRQYTTNDAAIQLARDEYLRQLEEQRLKEQPSFLNRTMRRTSPKEFRHTVRTGSTNSHGTAIQSPLLSTEPVKIKSIGRKARTVSQTLKKALKRVFGRPFPGEPKLPEQHVSADKAHYGERTDGGEDDGEHRYSPIPSPDIELLRRVNSRESILREISGYEENMAAVESIRSMATDVENNNRQSRVTSWTDSTVANTINMPQFVEHKRLSIIREDGGPHQPSSSAGRYMDPADGYAVFRQPVRLNDAGPAAAQRVYSALQREIRKSEQSVALDDSDSGTDSSSDQLSSRPSCSILGRTSSGRKIIDGQNAVGPQPHSISASRSVLFNPTPIVTVNHSFLRPDQRRYRLPDCEHGYVEPADHLTPQQIAHLNEPELPPPKKPLREVKSAFFPSESRIERRTKSPYRRAMYDSGEDADQLHDASAGANSNLWVESPRLIASVRNSSAAISESIYSRTEGGHSPRANGSSVSLPKSDSGVEASAAIIITSGLPSSEGSLPPNSRHRQASNISSDEWKRWMASEVSFLEDHWPEHDGIYNPLPAKEKGHKRENAQWDGEDVAIGRLCKSIQSAKQPLGSIQTQANPRPNVERFPFQNVKTSDNENDAPQKENTPKTRSQTPLMKQFSTKNERNLSTPTNSAFVGPRTKASQLALSTHSEKTSSPASANSQNSPGRAERLRRLQNRSSQSLNKTSKSPRTGRTVNQHYAAEIPPDSPCTLNRADQSSSTPRSQIVSSKALVRGLLKSRRSQMRISDESGGDPAFL